MRRVIVVVAGVATMTIGVLIYVNTIGELWPPALRKSKQNLAPTPMAQSPSTVHIRTIHLFCPDAALQGDVVFVTNLERSWTIQINKSDLPAPPPGYSLSPSSIQTEWVADTGNIEKIDDYSGRWSQPSREGVCTVTARQTIQYRSSENRSILRRKPPDLIYQGEGEIRFLVPLYVPHIIDRKVDGFRVGRYPSLENPNDLAKSSTPERVRRHPDTYRPPTLWYRVDESTRDLRIAWEYRLGDFDLDPRFHKEPYPHYIALDPNLLLKLHALKERMNRDGFHINKFDIIYGFRSPRYNLGSIRQDGKTTLKSSFSVHMYGKAADILVDQDHDLVMDDLNKDGKIDINDARVILRYVDELDREYLKTGSPLVGGAGVYYHHDFWERGKVAQSPYIHVDVRGFGNEQGRPIRWIGKNTLAQHNGSSRNRRTPYRILPASAPGGEKL